jgi:hypothetical protein
LTYRALLYPCQASAHRLSAVGLSLSGRDLFRSCIDAVHQLLKQLAHRPCWMSVPQVAECSREADRERFDRAWASFCRSRCGAAIKIAPIAAMIASSASFACIAPHRLDGTYLNQRTPPDASNFRVASHLRALNPRSRRAQHAASLGVDPTKPPHGPPPF